MGLGMVVGSDPVAGLFALGAFLVPLAMLSGCPQRAQPPQSNACFDGSPSCAAAEAPRGMRHVLKGHRMVRAQWVQKNNRESGAPDIGLQAEWEPLTERQ